MTIEILKDHMIKEYYTLIKRVDIFFLLIVVFSIPFFSAFIFFIVPLWALLPSTSNSKFVIPFKLCFFSLSMAVVYTSNDIFSSRDFLAYFDYYNCINDVVGSGQCEKYLIGYNIFNQLVFMFFGFLSPVAMAIVFKFLLIYFTAMVTYFYLVSKYKINNIVFVVLMSCLLMRLGSLSLLWRQTLATVFIIILLSQSSNLKRFFCFLLSASVHITSIVIAPLTYFFLNKKINAYYFSFFVAIVLLFHYFSGIYYVYNFAPSFIARKVYFMLEPPGLNGIVDVVTGTLPLMPIIGLCFFSLLTKRKIIPASLLFERNCVIYIFILWGVMSIFFNHSFRVIFPLSLVFVGMYSALILNSITNRVLFVFSLTSIWFLSSVRVFGPSLFELFDMFNFVPFYYLF